jgi:hypothetical protein
MKFSRHLAKVELVALASLAVVAVVLAIYAAISMSLHPSPEFSAADSVKVVLVYILPIGCVTVALFVAPLYSTLLQNGWTSWPVAFVIGAIPGAVLLFFSVFFVQADARKAARRLTPALELTANDRKNSGPADLK